MEILYIILGISLTLNIILIVRGTQLVKQIEETQSNSNETQLNTLETLESMLAKMRELDLKGSFESDDEVGVVFTELKDVIETYKNNL
jgi:hypothetical protein